MAHIKQRVPPEQPAGSPQFTREEERDGKTLNLVLMESREGMEEREVGEKRQSASVRANEREGEDEEGSGGEPGWFPAPRLPFAPHVPVPE